MEKGPHLLKYMVVENHSERGHSHFAPWVNSPLSGAKEEEDAPGQAGRTGTTRHGSPHSATLQQSLVAVVGHSLTGASTVSALQLSASGWTPSTHHAGNSEPLPARGGSVNERLRSLCRDQALHAPTWWESRYQK